MSRRIQLWLLPLLTLATVIAVMSLGRVPQPQVYHHFCDQRIIWGIPHFGDVLSNLAFLLVGALGIRRIRNADISATLKRIYTAVFTGILLTGLGSAIYHLHPDDQSLVYDRLPMTLVFMGMTSAALEESIGRVGGQALWPLLAAGAGSIWWWRYTQLSGDGDLRPYILVQYYPFVLIPLTLLLFPNDRTRRGWPPLLLCFICYGAAKATESLDCPIFSLTGWISGHTVKHLLSALAVYFLVLRSTIRD